MGFIWSKSGRRQKNLEFVVERGGNWAFRWFQDENSLEWFGGVERVNLSDYNFGLKRMWKSLRFCKGEHEDDVGFHSFPWSCCAVQLTVSSPFAKGRHQHQPS